MLTDIHCGNQEASASNSWTEAASRKCAQSSRHWQAMINHWPLFPRVSFWTVTWWPTRMACKVTWSTLVWWVTRSHLIHHDLPPTLGKVSTGQGFDKPQNLDNELSIPCCASWFFESRAWPTTSCAPYTVGKQDVQYIGATMVNPQTGSFPITNCIKLLSSWMVRYHHLWTNPYCIFVSNIGWSTDVATKPGGWSNALAAHAELGVLLAKATSSTR